MTIRYEYVCWVSNPLRIFIVQGSLVIIDKHEFPFLKWCLGFERNNATVQIFLVSKIVKFLQIRVCSVLNKATHPKSEHADSFLYFCRLLMPTVAAPRLSCEYIWDVVFFASAMMMNWPENVEIVITDIIPQSFSLCMWCFWNWHWRQDPPIQSPVFETARPLSGVCFWWGREAKGGATAKGKNVDIWLTTLLHPNAIPPSWAA